MNLIAIGVSGILLVIGLVLVMGWNVFPTVRPKRKRLKINDHLYEIETYFQTEQPSAEAIEACLTIRREFLKVKRH